MFPTDTAISPHVGLLGSPDDQSAVSAFHDTTDAGDSAQISGSFLRLSIFPVGRLRRSRPSAGNAGALPFATNSMKIYDTRLKKKDGYK